MPAWPPPLLPPITVGFLEGLVAAVGSMALAAFLMAFTFLTTRFPDAEVWALLETALAGGMTGAAGAALGGVINLPLIRLFARRYRGPFGAALVLAAGLGALEAWLILPGTARFGVPGLHNYLAVLGGLGGGMIAWRVWRRCVAPHRNRPASAR